MPEIPQALLDEATAERPELKEVLDALGLRSAMIVPISVRGRTLGAISFIWAESGKRYGDADLDLAVDLARRVGIAVDNAQLYRSAEERSQAARVLASIGDGVMLVDTKGVVRYWNRAAEAITGLPASAVLDRPAVEAIAGWSTAVQRVPISFDPVTPPRAQTLPLGTGEPELWLSITGVAVVDGTVYAFRDLTEERALDTLKTEFVSTVSHELRTPLAAIYGAAMTLQRQDVVLDAEQNETLLSVITNESDRLARTVNAILWASRLDTDALSTSVEPCDPLVLGRDVVEAQRAHLPSRIRLEFDAPAKPATVAADPDKVRQVLVNLLDNAVKYSPDGGEVRLSIESNGRHVRFSISDEGLGIPYGEQRRIFEKFYRLDPQMTRGIGGTGLGLYICRELVRRMDGRIWVTSDPGRGSTFAFELPVA
jgi:two-component system sensor histidine kinase VicK